MAECWHPSVQHQKPKWKTVCAASDGLIKWTNDRPLDGAVRVNTAVTTLVVALQLFRSHAAFFFLGRWAHEAGGQTTTQDELLIFSIMVCIRLRGCLILFFICSKCLNGLSSCLTGQRCLPAQQMEIKLFGKKLTDLKFGSRSGSISDSIYSISNLCKQT